MQGRIASAADRRYSRWSSIRSSRRRPKQTAKHERYRRAPIGSDAGQPIVDHAPDGVEAKAFRNLAGRCIELAKAEARAVGGWELERNLRLPENLAEIGENLPPDLAAAGDDALRGEIEDLVARERERVRSLK